MRPDRQLRIAAGLALALIGAPASAQPVDLPIPAATTTVFPPGVSVRRIGEGDVYVDAQGRTLYGMDMRTVLRWAPDPVQYCKGECAQQWEPLLAPANAGPAVAFPSPREQRDRKAVVPDWAVANGPAGPQWVYKRWHLVFTRKGEAPGSAAFDGADNLTWNSLKHVPPVPKLVAPGTVKPLFVAGAYALADLEGRLLFTGKCGDGCSGWTPLAAGLAAGGTGDWGVSRSGDAAQWSYRGSPVFVGAGGDPASVPPGGTILRP
jgi:predicted lipoprotein with Yx(FWY)xxD motif